MLARNSATTLLRTRSSSILSLIQQIDRLHIAATGGIAFPDISSNSKSSIGFSCSSPNSTTILTTTMAKNYLPITEQRRYRKFFIEWTWNYKHKQGHKHVFKPYFKWDYRQIEDAEYTHKPFRLAQLNGRDPETGERVNVHITPGFKFDWFWVDYRRNRYSSTEGGCYEERILEVRRAPNQTSYVALACGAHGRRWILATENMKAGDVVRSYNYIPNKMLKDYEMPEGDSWPIGALPPGATVCNIQKFVGADYSLNNDISDYQSINAGGSATILRHQGEFTVVQITKVLEIAVKRECICVLGRLSNVDHGDLHWGSMNMKRRWGIKQGSGVWHKKDGYCGRKAHPLKRKTIDPENEPPPPMKIPLTLDRNDYACGFGTASTMPKILRHPLEDNRELPDPNMIQ